MMATPRVGVNLIAMGYGALGKRVVPGVRGLCFVSRFGFLAQPMLHMPQA